MVVVVCGVVVGHGGGWWGVVVGHGGGGVWCGNVLTVVVVDMMGGFGRGTCNSHVGMGGSANMSSIQGQTKQMLLAIVSLTSLF